MKVFSSLIISFLIILPTRYVHSEKRDTSPALSLLLLLPTYAAFSFVPPPADEINGRYTYSKFQEENWKNYLSRQQLQPAKNLPWIYGQFETPVYISQEVGEELLFEYSTFCANWGFTTIACKTADLKINVPSGNITQVSYNLTSIMGIVVKVRILFYGTKKESITISDGV